MPSSIGPTVFLSNRENVLLSAGVSVYVQHLQSRTRPRSHPRDLLRFMRDRGILGFLECPPPARTASALPAWTSLPAVEPKQKDGACFSVFDEQMDWIRRRHQIVGIAICSPDPTPTINARVSGDRAYILGSRGRGKCIWSAAVTALPIRLRVPKLASSLVSHIFFM